MGAEWRDLPCLAQDRGVPWCQHSLALHTAPPGTQPGFFHASRKFFASPCLYLSGAFQKKSKQEFHLSRDTHSPGPGAFCQSGAQHLETRRGGGGCGHRAAYEGVPLALHSCGAPAVVAGGGLTLVNRAALPPAPSSPPPCSSPPTSPAMTRNGLGPPCVSCTTEWGGEGQDPHERLIWSPVAHRRLPANPGRKLPQQGEGRPEAQLTVKSPVFSRARPPLGEGMELSPPRPDSEARPSPHSNSLNATSLLIIDVQLVCTPAHPHFRVILLSTYDIMQRTITDSVKSCFQKGSVF